jgi:Cd2+/Zn2+-exporting ATPase
LCAACEQFSTHPIAVSILEAAKGLALPEAQNVQEYSGRGIRAVVDDRTVLCGNGQWMKENGISVDEVPGTVVYVAVEGEFVGRILIADTLKSGSADAVEQLHRLGISTAMLTGDSAETAHQVAAEVGIQSVYPKLLPQQKLEILQELRKHHGKVMFVGDGINDAPVLAGADVGAAMGSGADAAIEAADVVYMTLELTAVPESISIARRTRAIAWQNVVFALGVKAVVMVLGLLGGASMWLAVFADSGVAMLCVLNSIRMLYKK